MPRIYITGTDTDVGKTHVTAALALALRRSLPLSIPVTIVKPVQTGCGPLDLGDATKAAALANARLDSAVGAQVFCRELRRFRKASDGYSAALAEGLAVPTSTELATKLQSIEGAIVVEGSGGAAVPINEHETISHVAARAGLSALVVVGLRLGCINHALLTARYLADLGVSTLGAVLIERWEKTEPSYREEVTRALHNVVPIISVIPYDPAGYELTRAAHAFEEELCPV
ncbi:MAG TPA: dethiobiotin synthase [Candidatus Baltobacteraceae bacterium]|jgi:dethiobiotin synthetase